MNINTLLTKVFLVLVVISSIVMFTTSASKVKPTIDRINNLKEVEAKDDNVFMQDYKTECKIEITELQNNLIIGGTLMAILVAGSIIILATKRGRIIYKDRIKNVPEELLCWMFVFVSWSYCFVQPFKHNNSIFWAIIILALVIVQGMRILAIRNNKKNVLSNSIIMKYFNNYIVAINIVILLIMTIITYFMYKNYDDGTLFIITLVEILVLTISILAYLMDKNVDKNTEDSLKIPEEYTKYSLVVLNGKESYQRGTNIPIIITEKNKLEAVYNKYTNEFMFYLMPLKEELRNHSAYHNQMEIDSTDGQIMNINIKKYLYGFTDVYKKREKDENLIKNDKHNLRTAQWFLDEGWGSHKNFGGHRWLDLNDKNKFYMELLIKVGDKNKRFFIDVNTLRAVRISDNQIIEDYNNGIIFDKEENDILVRRVNKRLDTIGFNKITYNVIVDNLCK